MNPCRLAILVFGAVVLATSVRAGHVLTNPTASALALSFAAPPAEYSSQVTWGWSGIITREVIARDLDKLKGMNIAQAWVEPGRNPQAPYLSPAYFENVKIAVEEAKKRGMQLWFDDDGGYPSGFAGGKFTTERPDLTMKALADPERVPVAPGSVFARAWNDKTICMVAVELDTGATKVLPPAAQISWTAPADGRWAVSIVSWRFRSGVTKSANNKSGAKDNEHALMDYLSPEANRLFREWTFESYRRAVGDEFGKTFLGFRGDEAAYNFNPWTPDLLAEFTKRKGYDLRPYLPAVAAIQLGRRGRAGPVAGSTDVAHRAYADYSDVWSDLFGERFFAGGGQWCADHHLEMQTHIEHEEILPQLAIANGDYFKCMQGLQIPGVDVIWHQLWHDVVADFPKLASSAAHLNGRPLAMSETFAAMNGRYPTPNLEEAGWILHHQIALGITHFEYMSMRASASGAPRPVPGSSAGAPPPPMQGSAPPGYRYLQDEKFPQLAQEVNRTTYVLAQGRPAAQIGVYIPSSSFWFGDTATNASFVALVHALLEQQRDVDFIDDGSLARTLQVRRGALVNKSGQEYRAVIVPPAIAISEPALDRLKEFSRAGGRVVFLGGTPQLALRRNFLSAQAPADVRWATVAPASTLTPAILAALPAPDLAIDHPTRWLKYNHRRLRNAEVYYLFNEGEAAVEVSATLSNAGRANKAEDWDAGSGQIRPITGATFANGKTTVPVQLAPWEAKLVVVTTD